jgi:general secretion pathway protein A
LVRRAAGEVYGRRFMPRWLGWAAAGLTAAAAAAVVVFGGWRHQTAAVRSAKISAAAAGEAAMPASAPPVAAAVAPAAAMSQAAAPLTPAAVTPAAALSKVAAPSQSAALTPTAVMSQAATVTSVAARPQAVAPAPQPAALSIDAVLAANAADTGDTAAFRRLLSLWGTAMTDDHDPCGQAQKAGLACLEQRGSWAQVRELNRPAILTLADGRGVRHRVVLSALDDKFATLNLGDHGLRLPLDEVSRDWFGEFTIVWKPKTLRTRKLSLGMHGDEVRWLRRSLAALGGASSDPEYGDVYDEELAIAVQNFQREHRLNVDGIAGLQTQVVLDTALAEPGSPLLLQITPHG